MFDQPSPPISPTTDKPLTENTSSFPLSLPSRLPSQPSLALSLFDTSATTLAAAPILAPNSLSSLPWINMIITPLPTQVQLETAKKKRQQLADQATVTPSTLSAHTKKAKIGDKSIPPPPSFRLISCAKCPW